MSALLAGGFVDVPLFAGTATGVATSVAGAAEIAAAGGVAGVGLTAAGAAAETALAAEALATTVAAAGAAATVPVAGWVAAGVLLLAGVVGAIAAMHASSPIGQASASPLLPSNKSTAIASPVAPESGVNMPLPGNLITPGVPQVPGGLKPSPTPMRPKKRPLLIGGPDRLLIGPSYTYSRTPADPWKKHYGALVY